MSTIQSSKTVITKNGVILEALKNSNFKVSLDDEVLSDGSAKIVLAHLSGKLRRYYIRLLVGDKVVLEFSPHDLDRGRIVARK